ncbi:hypothetical protein TTHMIC_00025 [Tetrahymena thermophila SB210]|uniref:Uncharacterized protein n=1 Tax=Tetrahymena thermophila (strain SB210) TaxID=312017 RepID=A0A1B9C272_TETTS|nr:hypothetical protein TTHMIC_00025 [Tetrahymena thermophila SB210]
MYILNNKFLILQQFNKILQKEFNFIFLEQIIIKQNQLIKFLLSRKKQNSFQKVKFQIVQKTNYAYKIKQKKGKKKLTVSTVQKAKQRAPLKIQLLKLLIRKENRTDYILKTNFNLFMILLRNNSTKQNKKSSSVQKEKNKLFLQILIWITNYNQIFVSNISKTLEPQYLAKHYLITVFQMNNPVKDKTISVVILVLVNQTKNPKTKLTYDSVQNPS